MFQGRAAVVTGAASGFGRALTIELAKRGCRVVACDIDEKGASQTCTEANAGCKTVLFQKCDVTSSESLSSAIAFGSKSFGLPISIFINNAGIALPPGSEFDSQRWKHMVAINLTAVIDGTRLAIEHMTRERVSEGIILNVASAAGVWPQPLSPVYAAVKSGVLHFTRSLGHLKSSSNISVLAVAPTFFETPLLSDFRETIASASPIMSLEHVVSRTMSLIENGSIDGGSVLVIHPKKDMFWPSQANRARL